MESTGQPFTHVCDLVDRPQYLSAWEKYKHHRRIHWLIECIAEATGVFLYCFLGVGSQAAWVIGRINNEPTMGTLFNVGIGYAVGIVISATICASSSGGHFNPCVTIAQVIFKGFPPLKAVRYILAQLIGAFIACLIVYLQWKGPILAAEATLTARGTLDQVQFTPFGPAGIFGFYPPAGAYIGYVFANEFFVDIVLALSVWATLDRSNFTTPPAAYPWVVGFTYAAAIWSYAPIGLAANTARDLGGRFAALCIWGPAASGGSYAALAALTNILSTIIAAAMYEFCFQDNQRVIPEAHKEFLLAQQGHLERIVLNKQGLDVNMLSSVKPTTRVFMPMPASGSMQSSRSDLAGVVTTDQEKGKPMPIGENAV